MRTAFLYSIFKRWAFVIATVFVLVMNYLSNALPFGGMTNADVSAKYPTLLTPAGYAFAIWGVIYLTLLIFAFFQLRRGREVRFYKLIWPWFMVNAAANGLWLVAFQNEWLGVSVLIMGVLLYSLIAMFRYFYRLRSALSTTHRFFFHLPFGIYFGWVSVASILNVALWLTSLEIGFLQERETTLAMIMIIVGFGIALWVLLSQKDYIYALTFVWALVAIMVNQMEISMVYYPAKVAAILLILVASGLFIYDRLTMAQYGRSGS